LRFAITSEEELLPDALDSLTHLLADQPGCLRCWSGRSTDEPTSWVVGSRWDSVGAYRRALSNYDVKVQASSLLGAANDEPSAFEVLLEVAGAEVVRRRSDRSRPQDDSRIR